MRYALPTRFVLDRVRLLPVLVALLLGLRSLPVTAGSPPPVGRAALGSSPAGARKWCEDFSVDPFSPRVGMPDTTVIIYIGDSQCVTPDDTVFFGRVPATHYTLNVNDATITTQVPVGAVTDFIRIGRRPYYLTSYTRFIISGDTTRPAIAEVQLRGVRPLGGNDTLRVRFTKGMDSATVAALRVYGHQSGYRPGRAWLQDSLLWFVPATPFLPGEQVSVLVDNQAADRNQLPLRRRITYSLRAASAAGPGFFVPERLLSAPHTISLQSGDLDGDGTLDIVCLDTLAHQVLHWPSDSARHYPAIPLPYAIAVRYRGLRLCDIDADGDLDALAYGPGFIKEVSNDGGQFRRQRVQQQTGALRNVNDLAIAAAYASIGANLLVIDANGPSSPNNPNGWSLSYSGSISTNLAVTSIAQTPALASSVHWLNLNNTGYLDALITGAPTDTLVWTSILDEIYWTGPVRAIALPAPATAVAVGDFNHDGFDDFAAVHASTHALSVWLNDGTGHFGAPVTQPVGRGPVAIAAGDIDGDGDLDLLTANAADSSVSVLRNTGAGAFAPAERVAVGAAPRDVLLGDFSGDGALDFLTINTGDGTIGLYRNTGPRLTIAGASARCLGDSVHLSTTRAAATYQWYHDGQPVAGATTPAYLATQPGTYFATLQLPNGTPLPTDSVVLAFAAPPVAGFAYAVARVCTTAADTLVATPLPGVGPGGTYTATPAGLQLDAVSGAVWPAGSTPGSYTVRQVVRGAAACPPDTASVHLLVEPPPPTPVVTLVPLAGGSIWLRSNAPAGNQWLFNRQPVAGATDSVLLVTAMAQSGAYAVRVTSPGGCSSDTSAAVYVHVVLGGAASVASQLFTLTPNPATGTVRVDCPPGATRVEIFDATGRLVRLAAVRPPETAVTLSLQGLAPGLYPVRVGAGVRRLVVQ